MDYVNGMIEDVWTRTHFNRIMHLLEYLSNRGRDSWAWTPVRIRKVYESIMARAFIEDVSSDCHPVSVRLTFDEMMCVNQLQGYAASGILAPEYDFWGDNGTKWTDMLAARAWSGLAKERCGHDKP